MRISRHVVVYRQKAPQCEPTENKRTSREHEQNWDDHTHSKCVLITPRILNIIAKRGLARPMASSAKQNPTTTNKEKRGSTVGEDGTGVENWWNNEYIMEEVPGRWYSPFFKISYQAKRPNSQAHHIVKDINQVTHISTLHKHIYNIKQPPPVYYNFLRLTGVLSGTVYVFFFSP